MALDTIFYEDENSPEARASRGLPAVAGKPTEKMEDIVTFEDDKTLSLESRLGGLSGKSSEQAPKEEVVLDTISDVPVEKRTSPGGEFNPNAEVRRATAVAPEAPPKGYKDQILLANESLAGIEGQLAQNIIKIQMTVPDEFQSRAIAIERAKAAKWANAVKLHVDAVGSKIYAGLQTPDKLKADRLSQEFGLDLAQSSEMAETDTKVKRQAQNVLSTFIGDPRAYGAWEKKLFGEFQYGPDGKPVMGPGDRPVRVGGLIEPNSMGLMQVNDPETFNMIVAEADAVRKKQLGQLAGTRGSGSDKADPRIDFAKDKISQLAADVDRMTKANPNDPRLPELTAKLESDRAGLDELLGAELEARGGLKPSVDPAEQRKALEQEQTLEKLNAELQKATAEETDPVNIVSKKNEILRNKAKAQGKPVLKVGGVEVLDKLGKLPAGELWYYETGDGKVEAGVWQGMDAYKAKAVLSPEQEKEIGASIKDAQRRVSLLRSKMKGDMSWDGSSSPRNAKSKWDPTGGVNDTSEEVALLKQYEDKIKNLQLRLDVSRKLKT